MLRSWHPTSNWVDSAQILISVRSISIDATTVRPKADADAARGGGGRGGEREFMVFRLEPVESGSDVFTTEQVSSDICVFTHNINFVRSCEVLGSGFACSASERSWDLFLGCGTYESTAPPK